MEQQNGVKNGGTKKIFRIICIILACASCFMGGYFSRYIFEPSYVNTTGDLVRIIEHFGMVLDPETGEMRALTEEDYADALVNGLLDQYSKYFTKEEFFINTQNKQGNLTGLGIIPYSNITYIYKIYGNSPAEKAGLMAEDFITAVSINDSETIEIKSTKQYNDVMATAPEYAKVCLTVTREGQFTDRLFTLQMDDFKVSYVNYYDSERRMHFETDDNGKFISVVKESEKMAELDSDTAYVKLDLFEGESATQFDNALKYMRDNGRTKLILDLRSNGGGDVRILTQIASCLIDNNGARNSVVAIAESKTGKENYTTVTNNFYKNITKMSVIANDGTASASECLIGALLSYNEILTLDRVVLEKNHNGEGTTYGKGIMQTTYSLIGGGAFKLTTARMLWPDGKTCIHNVGIKTSAENSVDAGENAINRAIEVLK